MKLLFSEKEKLHNEGQMESTNVFQNLCQEEIFPQLN